ncbi:MAG: hypothetical protein NTV86_20570 [Planctomycetota bacterium]|nr:hypothetical protein [Planctomycetota bacterium]
MGRKKGGNRSGESILDPTAEIRAELRSIVRQLEDLRHPIGRFEELPDPTEGQPTLYVHFDDRPRRRINGLRICTPSVALPDERITDAVLSTAQGIWHLKDRLMQWCKVHGCPEDVEVYARQSPDLLVCADLANRKKHGRHENRSGCDPRLGVIKFDTSQSGVIELFYDGATKEKGLLVTEPRPLSFSIPVLAADDKTEIGDALGILAGGLQHWKTLIRKVGILEGTDPETVAVKQMFGLL